MTEEKAKKVSDLYAEQSKYSNILSMLLSSNSDLTIHWSPENSSYLWSHTLDLPKKIKKDMQKILIEKVTGELTRVKLELAEINCT